MWGRVGGAEGALTWRASDLNRSLISVCKLQLLPGSLLSSVTLSFITHSRLVSVQSITPLFFSPLLRLLALPRISDSLLSCSFHPEIPAVTLMFQLPRNAEQLLSIMVHLTALVIRPVFSPHRQSQLTGAVSSLVLPNLCWIVRNFWWSLYNTPTTRMTLSRHHDSVPDVVLMINGHKLDPFPRPQMSDSDLSYQIRKGLTLNILMSSTLLAAIWCLMEDKRHQSRSLNEG